MTEQNNDSKESETKPQESEPTPPPTVEYTEKSLDSDTGEKRKE